MTVKEKRALKIVSECKCTLGITPKQFGVIYFDTPEHGHLLEATSNIGNGAACGVKAWLQAGSMLAKLAKKGYVRKLWGKYIITELGIKSMEK